MSANFRAIPGMADYFVGDDGTVWTEKTKGAMPRKMTPQLTKAGYCTVSLTIQGRQKTFLVHRLVLLAFVGPPPTADHQACHYPDFDKTNNKIGNLRWDTRSENGKDKFRERTKSGEKACTKCGAIKSFSCFPGHSQRSDGRQSCCRKCHTKTAVATRDPDKQRAFNREYMKRRYHEKKAILARAKELIDDDH